MGTAGTINITRNITRTETPVLKRLIDHVGFVRSQRATGIHVPDSPHFDPLSLPYFFDALDKSKSYLEFGAGGSTLEVARRNIPGLSIESDAGFAQAVRSKLGNNPSIKVIDADIGITTAWGAPLFNTPRFGRAKRWQNYTNAAFTRIKELGQFPDFVLVDGRFRRACALETARQAGLAGATTQIFFDDYDGRAFYSSIETFLGKPKMVGRAAIFSVNGGPAAQAISLEDVRSAQRDPR
jgi:hypothetical protein